MCGTFCTGGEGGCTRVGQVCPRERERLGQAHRATVTPKEADHRWVPQTLGRPQRTLAVPLESIMES